MPLDYNKVSQYLYGWYIIKRYKKPSQIIYRSAFKATFIGKGIEPIDKDLSLIDQKQGYKRL